MRALDKLKKEAREAAGFRGHELTRFESKDHKHSAYAECKTCGMSVVVNDKPAPNNINIGGSAVAMNCKKKGARQDYGLGYMQRRGAA